MRYLAGNPSQGVKAPITPTTISAIQIENALPGETWDRLCGILDGIAPVFVNSLKDRFAAADSTGGCNTFAEHFSRCMEAEGFSRPLVQLSRNCIELSL